VCIKSKQADRSVVVDSDLAVVVIVIWTSELDIEGGI
jgi:hypothetical protein